MLQLWRVGILEMWSTVVKWSQAVAWSLGPRCSSSVTKATSCPATASSPATTETQPRPSGARGCPSVSVSHTSHTHVHIYSYTLCTCYCIYTVVYTVWFSHVQCAIFVLQIIFAQNHEVQNQILASLLYMSIHPSVPFLWTQYLRRSWKFFFKSQTNHQKYTWTQK